MASTGDDASDTDSLPDDVFQRSSSAVAEAEEEVQYAQNPQGDSTEAPAQYRRYLEDDHNEQDNGPQHGSDEDYSDEDDDRENRFDGSANTWRFFTESERALAASLDQKRASDLSIHLYNAHALEVGVRDPEAASRAKHHLGKKHWIKADGNGVQPWHPHADWTAWPLRPEDVPRIGESFGVPVPSREDEKATYRKPESWKPSVDLEEEIQAIMLRMAKDRLQEHGRLRLAQNSSPFNRSAQESPPRKRKRSSSVTSSDAPSSQGEERASTSGSERRDSPAQDDEQSFDVVIDDDEAAEILQPSVRHIISKLDDLLLGLHKSRKGRVRESASPRSRSRSQRRKSRTRIKQQAGSNDDNVDSPLEETDGRKRAPRSGSQPTGEAQSSAVSNDAEAEDPAALKGDKKPKRKPKLNPRDWSEVLGMACLVGWDPEVIQRASARCSSLFGESMTFQELGDEVKGNAEDQAGAGAGQGFVAEEDVEESGYSCPVKSCSRHTEPWPLNKTWRWREHLKRSHKYSKAAIEKLEMELKA